MKKIILVLGMSVAAFGQSVAMSSDKVDTKANAQVKAKSCSAHGRHHKSGYIHKFVDIYATDNSSADKVGMIKFKERGNYNIFYCKESDWCQVVNQKDGNTGWVDLEELKKSQKQYAKVMQKKRGFDELSQYVQLQDQKIVELQTVIMQMQKELGRVLQNQQTQINQLQQSNYY
ncbi:MAG: hypothetical protein ACI8TE_000033 [Francisella sp.]|jgi:hypothetical protein